MKKTCFKTLSFLKNRAGMSLVEVLVTTSIFLVVVGGLVQVIPYTLKFQNFAHSQTSENNLRVLLGEVDCTETFNGINIGGEVPELKSGVNKKLFSMVDDAGLFQRNVKVVKIGVNEYEPPPLPAEPGKAKMAIYFSRPHSLYEKKSIDDDCTATDTSGCYELTCTLEVTDTGTPAPTGASGDSVAGGTRACRVLSCAGVGGTGGESVECYEVNSDKKQSLVGCGEGTTDRDNRPDNSTFFGFEAGKATTGVANTFVGSLAGQANTSGANNIFIGSEAGGRILNFGDIELTGNDNIFMGYQSGFTNTTGYNNIFMGNQAGYANTEGNFNTFIGHQAGKENTRGEKNIFIGHEAGKENIKGKENVFVGYKAGEKIRGGGRSNSYYHGSHNVFVGHEAGLNTGGGFTNTFIGHSAGNENTSGYHNTFVGYQAGLKNNRNSTALGSRNSFFGAEAGKANTSGQVNTFVGHKAGHSNTDENRNSFFGHQAGYYTKGQQNSHFGAHSGNGRDATNKQANYNSFFGYKAGSLTGANQATEARKNNFFGHHTGQANTTGSENSFFGADAGNSNTIGNGNTFIGNSAGSSNTDGSYNIFIGRGVNGSSPTARYELNIGNFITGNRIANTVTIHGNLHVTGTGTIGGGGVAITSDRRLKKKITNLDKQLSPLLKLKPRSFYWKDKTRSKTKQLGFIAQEVKKEYPELVQKGKDKKKTLSLNYNGIIPIIVSALKEFYGAWKQALVDLKKQIAGLISQDKKLIEADKKLVSQDQKLKREISSLKEKNQMLEKQNQEFKKLQEKQNQKFKKLQEKQNQMLENKIDELIKKVNSLEKSH